MWALPHTLQTQLFTQTSLPGISSRGHYRSSSPPPPPPFCSTVILCASLVSLFCRLHMLQLRLQMNSSVKTKRFFCYKFTREYLNEKALLAQVSFLPGFSGSTRHNGQESAYFYGSPVSWANLKSNVLKLSVRSNSIFNPRTLASLTAQSVELTPKLISHTGKSAQTDFHLWPWQTIGSCVQVVLRSKIKSRKHRLHVCI